MRPLLSMKQLTKIAEIVRFKHASRLVKKGTSLLVDCKLIREQHFQGTSIFLFAGTL